jgi:siroheme synthase-like protein
MKYYPINLNIKGKICVVIGGGKVAERKVKNILFCGGKVRVVSPDLTDLLSTWVGRKKIDYVQDEYHRRYLRGASLIYAATSDRSVNAQISKDAARLGLLVNVADSAKESTFIVPAVLRKKGITITVSSGGLSPGKSVRIRDRLKELIDRGLLAKHQIPPTPLLKRGARGDL